MKWGNAVQSWILQGCHVLLGRMSEAQGDVNQTRPSWMVPSPRHCGRELYQSHPIMKACDRR